MTHEQYPAIGDTLPNADAIVEAMGTTHEELGHFLQGFTNAAKSGAVEPTYVHFQDDLSRMYAFKDAAGSRDAYALLDNHPEDPRVDRLWTLVSLETGDSLVFPDSQPRRIAEQGIYTGERRRNRFVTPESIAEMAGIKAHTHPADDPVVEMLAASSASDIDPTKSVVLRTPDQIDRYGTILSLKHPATERTRVLLGFDDTAAMFKKLGQYGIDWLLKGVHDIEMPTDPAPIVVDSYDGVRSILSRIGTWGPESHDQILNLIQSMDIRDIEDWARPGNVQALIWSSVKFNEDGSYEVTADADLMRRLVCSPWDIVAGVYKAADGYYGESMRQKAGESKATHHQLFKLNEEHARVYSAVFSDVLMPSVEQARVALQIPDNIPEAEQVMYLFTKHHLLEKGLRIVRDENVQVHRPDMTVPQWGRACEVIDDVRYSGLESTHWELPDDARAVLKGYGLDAELIAHRMRTGPGVSSERLLRGVYRTIGRAILSQPPDTK